jgi:hypothetical protein
MRTLPFLMIAAMPLVLAGSSSAPASPSSSTVWTKEIEQTFSHEHRDCDLVGAEARKLCVGIRVWQLRHSSS